MDMQEFIARIDKRNFGVASFNTYIHDGVNCCFTVVAERGNSGRFLKEECPYDNLNVMLKLLLDNIEKFY